MLFAAPQSDAHGAIHPKVESLEDAHHLHHHRAAASIIGGAGSAVPGIKVRADHHQFVALRAARDFTHEVQAIDVLRRRVRLEIDAHSDRGFLLGQADDAIVLFFGHAEHRRSQRVLCLERSGLFDEHETGMGAIIRSQYRGRAFIRQKLIALARDRAVLIE